MFRRVMAWRQFSLRTLLLAMFVAAVFCGGYRFGFHAGQDKRLADDAAAFDSLIQLIKTTIAPNTWENVGGSGSITDVDCGCRIRVADTDSTGNEPVANTADPFGAANSQVTTPIGNTTDE